MFDIRLRNGVDVGDQIADAVAVDGIAELDLGSDLVALRDRNFAHVVPDTGDLG